jgi:H+/Cl- antiporter ClcA
MTIWQSLPESRRTQVVQLCASLAVGTGAFLFGRLATDAQHCFNFFFGARTWLTCLGAPFIFLAAAWIVRRFAPHAAGSGIPEVLRVVKAAVPGSSRALSSDLVSLRTAAIKVASAGLGYLGGASIGEEGPTVHISASILAFAARKSGRHSDDSDGRSFLVAGAAAGIAAAFNTPVAGIVFALEEIAESIFSRFKIAVILCVVVAVVTVRGLAGNEQYFGHVSVRTQAPAAMTMLFAVAAGALGGLFGGLFSRALTLPRLRILPSTWWLRALCCGLVCSSIAFLSHGSTSGSGHAIVNSFIDDPLGKLPALLFPEKFLTTVFSYLSGMAGGIFSPCLTIGAGLGVDLGRLLQSTDPKVCALIGMVAFFAGVVHAPLTAAIIVMEMSSQYDLIIPMLTAAYVARELGALVAPVPLYRQLAFPKEKFGAPDRGDKAIS